MIHSHLQRIREIESKSIQIWRREDLSEEKSLSLIQDLWKEEGFSPQIEEIRKEGSDRIESIQILILGIGDPSERIPREEILSIMEFPLSPPPPPPPSERSIRFEMDLYPGDQGDLWGIMIHRSEEGSPRDLLIEEGPFGKGDSLLEMRDQILKILDQEIEKELGISGDEIFDRDLIRRWRKGFPGKDLPLLEDRSPDFLSIQIDLGSLRKGSR